MALIYIDKMSELILEINRFEISDYKIAHNEILIIGSCWHLGVFSSCSTSRNTGNYRNILQRMLLTSKL